MACVTRPITMRLFLAIELPDPVRQHLAGHTKDRRLENHVTSAWGDDFPISVTIPQNLHVTLKFLGEVDESRRERNVVLVEGDQHLLAERRERVEPQLERHQLAGSVAIRSAISRVTVPSAMRCAET